VIDHGIEPPSTEPGRPYFDSGALAELFDRCTRLWDGVDDRFTNWVLASLPDDGGQTAVDLGCGAGRHTVLLAGRYQRVLAVDIAEQMLRIARSSRPHPAVDYQRRGVLDVTAEADGQFDLVLSVHTLHHVGDPALVLPHVRSLLAPGGTLVVADIVDPGWWATRDFHVNRAFAEARLIYQRTSHGVDAADLRQLLLHPRWLLMAAADTPLTREGFHAEYGRVFPGVRFTDDLHPLMGGAVWHAPGGRRRGGTPWS